MQVSMFKDLVDGSGRSVRMTKRHSRREIGLVLAETGLELLAIEAASDSDLPLDIVQRSEVAVVLRTNTTGLSGSFVERDEVSNKFVSFFASFGVFGNIDPVLQSYWSSQTTKD